MIRAIWILVIFPCFVGADSATNSILAQYDKGNYAETARLLQSLKEEDPGRYSVFPYALLHAKSLVLAGNKKAAFEIYKRLSQDSRMATFALLPIARMAEADGNFLQSIRAYQSYLSNSRAPDYNSVALEALNLCLLHTNAVEMLTIARIVERNAKRIAQLYTAKARRMRGETTDARILLLSLIRSGKKDDVTSQALTELDTLEGPDLPVDERISRGKLAYYLWNFDLAQKYLQNLAGTKMEAGYYYGRTLFLIGNLAGAKKAFQTALTLWPKDKMAKMCLYQYANVFLREGDYEHAAQLFDQVRQTAKGDIQVDATAKLIHARRAQGRFEDALRVVQPSTQSRNASIKGAALLLRGRIYFQMGRYKDALADFTQTLQAKSFRDNREVQFWRGIALQKLNRDTEASSMFQTLASSSDYYGYKARERATVPAMKITTTTSQFTLSRLPDESQEDQILVRANSGDILPALLYLHLYEEASQLLPSVTQESWKLLGVDSKNRQQRYLGIVYLSVLGKNFSTATYYAEIFLKTLPKNFQVLSLPEKILKTLFPLPYREEIERFSRERKIDPLVVVSIMKQESKFKRFARSQSFARGLMQLIPSTAIRMASAVGEKEFSVEQLYHPEINIKLGTRYMQDLVTEFGSEIEKIAAGYNSGESNVRRWIATSTPGEIMDFFSSIDFSETRKYVMIVKTNYELYKRIYGPL